MSGWGGRPRLRFGFGRRLGSCHVNAPTDNGAILDEDSGRLHVAVDGACAAESHAIQANDIPGDVTENRHVPGLDVGTDPSAGADGQAALLEPDGTFHLSVDHHVLKSAESPLESEGFPDAGCLRQAAAGRHRQRPTGRRRS